MDFLWFSLVCKNTNFFALWIRLIWWPISSTSAKEVRIIKWANRLVQMAATTIYGNTACVLYTASHFSKQTINHIVCTIHFAGRWCSGGESNARTPPAIVWNINIEFMIFFVAHVEEAPTIYSYMRVCILYIYSRSRIWLDDTQWILYSRLMRLALCCLCG